MNETVYMVIKNNKLCRSGKSYTPFTTTHISRAKAHATRNDGVVVVVTEFKKLEDCEDD